MTKRQKRPALAFAVLVVIVTAVIGNQYRADAERSSNLAEQPRTAHALVESPAAR